MRGLKPLIIHKVKANENRVALSSRRCNQQRSCFAANPSSASFPWGLPASCFLHHAVEWKLLFSFIFPQGNSDAQHAGTLGLGPHSQRLAASRMSRPLTALLPPSPSLASLPGATLGILTPVLHCHDPPHMLPFVSK